MGIKNSGVLYQLTREGVCRWHILGLVVFWFLIQFNSWAHASQNSGITYHGRILRPDGTPLDGANVLFKLQIRTPGNENCLLFEEIQGRDMRNSNGLFSITINDGTGSRGADEYAPGQRYSLERVFQNRGSFSPVAGCAVGNTYIPNSADGRRFVVMFRDETMSDWEPLPATTINFVPLSLESRSVGGFNASQLLRVEDGGVPQDVAALSLTDVTELRSLIDGTSTQYMPASNSSGATLPSFAGGAPASPQPGSIWFDSNDGTIKFFDGTSTQTLGAGGGGGGVTSITAGAGLTGGTITSTGTIALEDVGTPGTYFKVTTDAKGRVTSGSATLDAADIPSLDWSKIATGKPTDLAGYGITDAVKNSGGIVSMQAGNDADKPAAGTAGRVYMAIDTQKIYRDDGTNWIVVASVDAGGGGGSVTEVTVSGAPLSVINGTTTPQISISQAGASSSGYLSQTDWNTFNSKLGSALNAGQIYVGNSSNVATARTPGGDVSMNESGSFTVQKIQGSSVSSTTPVDGQVLKYVGGGTNEWQPANFSIGDLKTTGGASQFANASCAANQTLTWSSLTDAFSCTNIDGLDASAITSGTLDIARIPTGTTGTTVALGNDSRIVGAVQRSGDTMTGDLELPANGLKVGTNQIVASGGKVGVGTATPSVLLDVAGTLKVANGGESCSVAGDGGMIRYNSGNLQFCNGSSWQTLGVSGAGLTSLNGQTGSTQTFAIGTSGTEPTFSSSSDVHTLNLPMASGAGVTAGLISKVDYDAFSGKQPAGNYITALTGDVAASGPGSATATIQNNAVTTSKIADSNVTYAKIQNVTSGRILGRSTAGAGTVEEISIGSGLSLSGGTLSSTANGTVTSVSSANSYISVANGTTTPTLTLNVGTSANTVAAGNDSRFPSSACGSGNVMRWNGTAWVCETASASDPTKVSKSGDTMTGALELPANGLKVGTNQIVTTGGKVGIGEASPWSKLHVSGSNETTSLYVTNLNSSQAQYPLIEVRNYMGSVGSGSPSINVYNARGSYSSPQALSAWDTIGEIGFLGQKTTSQNGYGTGAAIRSYTSQNWQSGATGAYLSFATTGNNETSATDRLTITSSGNVGIGTTDPSAKLEVAGGVKVANDTTCNSSKAGTIRWTGSAFEGCNGSSWVSLSGGGGGGITSCPSGWTRIGDAGKNGDFLH